MSIDFMALLEEELGAMGRQEEAEAEAEAPPAPAAAPEAPVVCAAARAPISLALPPDWQEACRVGSASGIGNVWVVPEAVSAAGADELLRCVNHPCAGAKWVALHGRGVQEWGRGEAVPEYLGLVLDTLKEAGVWGGGRGNHVLINRYAKDGGIMPHTDGPAYYPATATLSLAQPALLRFAPLRAAGSGSGGEGGAGATLTVHLPPRTLVVFDSAAYTGYTHEIIPGAAAAAPADCVNFAPGRACVRDGERVSLTMRVMHELCREGA